MKYKILRFWNCAPFLSKCKSQCNLLDAPQGAQFDGNCFLSKQERRSADILGATAMVATETDMCVGYFVKFCFKIIRIRGVFSQWESYFVASICRCNIWYLNKGRPTWWHLLYYVNLLLNMFQMLIHPSSGACDYLVCYCVGCIVLTWGVLVLCSGIGCWWCGIRVQAEPLHITLHIDPPQWAQIGGL